jgi:hypothetical protein
MLSFRLGYLELIFIFRSNESKYNYKKYQLSLNDNT